MTAWNGLRAAAPLEWMRTITRGLDLRPTVKNVGVCLALHAREDGTNAYPGWKRLAWESGYQRRAVIDALGTLESLGLIWCRDRGSQHGRQGWASNYTLTLHDELDVLALSFEQWCKANAS